MTDALREEEQEFQQALAAMDEVVRKSGGVGHPVLGRAIALGRDVLNCSSILRTLHADATDTYANDPQSQGLIVRFGSRLDTPNAADRLGTAYKVLLLFVRAYQDAIYAVLFEL